MEGNGGDAGSGQVEQVLEPEDLIPVVDWNLVVKESVRVFGSARRKSLLANDLL